MKCFWAGRSTTLGSKCYRVGKKWQGVRSNSFPLHEAQGLQSCKEQLTLSCRKNLGTEKNPMRNVEISYWWSE